MKERAPGAEQPAARPTARRGFTLLELVVVIGLIAVLTGFVFAALAGGGKSAALQSGQATIAALASAARTRAMATGRRARVLICHDVQPAIHFRRVLALQEETDAGEWLVRERVVLPDGIFVVPFRTRFPGKLVADAAAWRRADSAETLASSALFRPPIDAAIGGAAVQRWEYIEFTPAGTTATSGYLVLATGHVRSPASVVPGESPVELDSPESVRGVTLSSYGLVRAVNDRSGFQ